MSSLITSLIQSCANVLDGFLTNTMQIVLYIDRFIGQSLISTAKFNFTPMFDIVFYFGISLIVLKFLKKGFDIYTCWNSGDPDLDPLNLIVNFVQALVIAISFPYLYGLLSDVTIDLTDSLLKSMILSTNNLDIISLVLSTITTSFFTVVAGLILVIIYFMLFIQFIMRGTEMLILRIGMPIACVGLIDSDKGVFAPYLKKFFQNAITITIQVVLVKMSIILMMSSDIIFSIAVGLLAIKTPRFLQEFMINPSSGGIGMGAHHTYKTVQMVTRMLKK